MYIVSILAIIINIISILTLLTGLFYNFKNPKSKAMYGYLITGCMLLYIIILILALVFGFLEKQYFYSIILLLCIISHFIIGKLVKYETLKKYTIIQTIIYIMSLIILFINIIK